MTERGQHIHQQEDKSRTIAEWTSLIISAVILLLTIGPVTYQYFSRGVEPVAIEVKPRLEEVRERDGLYYLPIEVTNQGDQTAESVQVELSLQSGQRHSETSELQIQFLAGGAIQEGTVIFRQDPSKGRLEVDVISYLKP